MNALTRLLLTNVGEAYRWYLIESRHPLKAKLTGHYWNWFCRPRVWIRYDEGLVISTSLRDYIQRTIFFEGLYEPHVVNWLKSQLRSNDVFWDVGANIGAMSLLVATRCRQVISFEPEHRALALLRAHVAANALPNIQIVDVALCDRDGVIAIGQAPESNTGMSSISRVLEGWPCYNVQATTADSVVRQRAILPPSIMKVDVEGAEEMVFRGASTILETPGLRAIIFEAKEGEGMPANANLVSLLSRYDFTISPFGRSDPKVNDGTHNYLAVR